MSIAGYMVANFPASKWPWRPTFEHVHVRSVVKKGPLAQDLDTLMSVTTQPAELVTSHIVVFMFSHSHQPPESKGNIKQSPGSC